MPPKKRHDSSVNTLAKKQKTQPSPEDFTNFYKTTLDIVYSLRDENNERALTSAFQKLPSKKQYPDYYEIISYPITITDIQKNLAKGKYSSDSTEEYLQDFKQLFDNANLYNDPDSWIVHDAKQIYEFVQEQVMQFNGNENAVVKGEDSKVEEITFDQLPKLTTDILNDVIEHEFPETGPLSGPFIEDIDRKEYPDYFKVIAHPTSFNKVLSSIKKNKLFSNSVSLSENLEAFHKQTSLIFENARIYNEPESLIYQDSNLLQKYFDLKYNELKSKVDKQTSHSKITLKLKPPVKKEPTQKVKINLKLKPTESSEQNDVGNLDQQEQQEQVKRSRTRKRKAESPVKDEPQVDQDQTDDEIEPNKDITEPDLAKDNTSTEGVRAAGSAQLPSEELDQSESAETQIAKTSTTLNRSNVLGKATNPLSPEEVFIQEISLSSSISNISQVIQDAQIQAQISQLSYPQQIKRSLFPSHYLSTVSSIFEYKFKSNGYSAQSYSISLPPDSNSFITLKISLHSLIYELKRHDLVEGQTFLNLASDDEFQFKLLVNDDEVSSGGDVFELEESLAVQYDLKLSHGLNVLEFEMKIAPNLNKQIKKVNPEIEDVKDSGVRHTRHQLQQQKMSWEIEKFSLFIISNSP